MKVRDLNLAQKKFATNGAAGSGNYLAGVQGNSTWMQNTENAESTWSAGVSAASSQKRFSKGVGKAGQQKWQSNSARKGQPRFQQAMSDPATASNWNNGFAPFAAVIAGITKDPKGVRGSPGNYAIVQKIGDALHAKKISG